MAQEEKEGGIIGLLCPGAIESVCGHFFPAGTPPVKRYSLLTAISALIFLTLPTIGAVTGGVEA